jgi:phage-related protein
MNENFMIEIKASVDEALKKLDKVTEELKDIGEESKKASASMEKSMKSATKSAALQAEAIKQAIVALVNFGKSSVETQKEVARLNAAFLASGNSVKQASKAYEGIFRFLGDSGASVEAAQQLAQITPDASKLREYEKVLQGVYAKFGTSIETGGLAEAINHTIQLGSVQGTLADAYEWLGISVDDVNAQLATFNTEAEREAFIRNNLLGLYSGAANAYERNNSALLDYQASQAQVNLAMAEAGQAILPLLTAINNLVVALINNCKPALDVVIVALATLINYISVAIKAISAFFSFFLGASETTKETADNIASVGASTTKATSGASGLNKALNGASKAAKELKKQTMGFDELNVLQSNSATDSGASGGGGVSGGAMPSIDYGGGFDTGAMDDFQKKMDVAKEKLTAILVVLGSIGLALLIFKSGDIISFIRNIDLMNSKFMLTLGYITLIAGAILLAVGYSDAWVNGLDWGNFALILGGMALVMGGVAMVFGTVTAVIVGIGLAISGVVLGVKDFIENSVSWQNILMIIIGLLGVFAAVLYVATLPIALIVTAIVAVVAAFVILWNKCEAFREFWIGLWEGIKELFNAFVEWLKPILASIGQFFEDTWNYIVESLKPLGEAIVRAFKEAWELIKVIWDMVKPYFLAAWEGIKEIWNSAQPFFASLWESIKAVFAVVVEYFKGLFQTAWEAIKFVWDAVVGYFTAIWDSIASIFSVVRNVLQGNWQEAWDGIKEIVNTWKEYFSDVWEGIKNVFASVGTWFGNTFKAAWKAITSIFDTVKTYFTGVWNTIKEIFSKVGSAIASAISGAVSKAVNSVLSTAVNIINGFISAINLAISLINEIPGVNIKKLKKLEVPKMAKGGIVDSATLAMIGENGKEAVVPLENNTEWIDKLADKIASRNNTPSKIVLNLDGKQLGWASINSINNITKQTGNLPLVLV